VERRTFLGVIAGGLLTAPLAAEAHRAGKRFRGRALPAALVVTITLAVPLNTAVAQPAAGLRRVVVVTSGVNPRSAPFNVAFENRLRELGWVSGQTLAVEFVAAKPGEGLAEVATAAVRRKPDVIVATGPEDPLRAVQQSTATIPIVMVAINYDPVAKGHVASQARPGGNVTGVLYRQLEVDAKQLEFLAQILSKGARVAVIWDPTSADQLHAVEAAARVVGTPIQKVEVLPPYDFETAFKTAQQGRAEGVLVLGSAMAFRERARIAQLALRHRLPSAGPASIAHGSGLLLGYGPDLNALFRRAAEYVDRILKGAKPADLPVEQPTKFELVINLKTAKALGLTIPPSLLQRADQVIE
jgi:putative ABC transport system substrate-binding protein